MSWRERAQPVGEGTEGGWRSRATPAQAAPVAPEESASVGGFAGNVLDNAIDITNPINIVTSLGQQMKQGFHDAPKQTAEMMLQLPQYVAKKILRDPEARRPELPLEAELREHPAVKDPARWAYERPVDAALTAAVPLMFARGLRPAVPKPTPAPAVAAPEGMNWLERMGARGGNAAVGVSPGTIEEMTMRGKNPGQTGLELGRALHEEGAVRTSAAESYARVQELQNQYGQQVDQALNNIRATNRSMGVYPELADPLKHEANKILKPLLDEANSLRESQYPTDKYAARWYRAAYNSLAEKAKKGGDFITLDDVRGELQKVGSQFNAVSKLGDKFPIISKLYGRLADLRDSMVQEIADAAGDQGLADALTQANQGFSRYTRIIPDAASHAAKEAVGKTDLMTGHPVRSILSKAEPIVARGAYKTGKFAKKAKKFLRDYTPREVPKKPFLAATPLQGGRE